MNIGGIVAETFKIFLGNPDVMFLILIFTTFISLLLSLMQLKKQG